MKTGFLALAVLAFGIGSAQAGTLDRVKARGKVVCGFTQGVPGFSNPDGQGVWKGFDVDLCRAVAAAVFDDPNAFQAVPTSARERFSVLQSGDIDVLIRQTTWTLSREAGLGTVPGNDGLTAQYVSPITETVIVDPHTIILKTRGPTPDIPKRLAQISIISDTLPAGVTSEDFNMGKAAIGTGPFKYVEWRRGDQLVLERNNEYWGNSRVVVMQGGQVCQTGPTEELFASPQHAYTRRLLDIMPKFTSGPAEAARYEPPDDHHAPRPRT